MNESGPYLLIVYDNMSLKRDVIPSWGFSCLISLPQYRILFDTGGDASILLHNMVHMGMDPLKIDSVVLSHGHGDHTGGLAGFLQYQNAVTLYTPKSFPRRFKDEVGLIGARVEEVGGPMVIQAGVHTTGELGGSMKEQSLVLKTSKGIIIVTGCAHPGIVEIVEQAVRLFMDNVYLLIGGFHLMGRSPMEIRRMMEKLDALNVERIAPCHCSGDTAKELFMKHYQEKYIACGVGLFLEVPAVGSSFTPVQTA